MWTGLNPYVDVPTRSPESLVILTVRPRAVVHLGLVALIGICSLTGCTKEELPLPTQPVTGKVTLDSKPLGGAEIWLVPADSNDKVKNAKMTVRPYAKTKVDGTFIINSYLTDDGAPLGEYRVMVVVEGGQANTQEEREDDMPAAPKPKGKRRPAIPAKYSDPTTSGLTFTVKEGPNELVLELKSK
ncbi:MAG: hypothetical protein C0467_09015 [Planctomycetaceae bacterium]|nr:hypothetical protein [Planctomycetaceae bacterium]